MNNASFRHALIALSHPVSIVALLVLLLNDYWWRQVAPSWFTGKIGDVAWLIFAPFLLAAILACFIPKHSANGLHTRTPCHLRLASSLFLLSLWRFTGYKLCGVSTWPHHPQAQLSKRHLMHREVQYEGNPGF